MSETILQIIDQVPPYLCRFMATKARGQKFMSHADIAAASGLAKSTVMKISVLRSWKRVHVETADRFSRACGVDLLNPDATRHKLIKSKRVWISHARGRQRQFIVKLMTQANGTETTGS